MLFAKTNAASENPELTKKIATALAFLRDNDLASFANGSVVIEPGVITANFMSYETVAPTEVAFETHDRFMDIQCMIAGQEIIGVADRATLSEKTPYNEQKDITFYHDPETAYSQVLLAAGTLVTLMPDEAHKPKIAVSGPETIKKVVIKILL